MARTLPADLPEKPLPEALNEISRAFHLHWVRRGKSIVFVRRLWDPRETFKLEVPEMAAIFEDVHRWVSPLAPYQHDLVPIELDRRKFYGDLTGDQIRAMQDGGLPFATLPPEQRTLWMKLSTHNAFGNAEMELGRAVQMFAGWERCSLVRQEVLLPTGPRRFVHLHHPDRNNPPTNLGSVQLSGSVEPSLEQEVLNRPAAPQPSGEALLPAPPRLPRAFRGKVRFRDGAASLEELAAAAAAASERQIELPAYARGRRLLAHVDGATAEEVVYALEDLYGWKLSAGTGRRYHLGRPRFEPARDLFDLQVKLRAAIPPAARLLMLNDDESSRAREARYYSEVPQIVSEVARLKGPDWNSCAVSELDHGLQSRLANVLFEGALRTQNTLLLRTEPYWWLSAPETGRFHLEGEVGPGKKPLLTIKVTRPGENGAIRFELWGWYVGSEKLND